MVSMRCKMVVEKELKNAAIHYVTIDLGMVKVLKHPTPKQLAQLQAALLLYGLELMKDKKAILIEKIKKNIIKMVHYSDTLPKINYSDFISKQLGYDYTYLATLFSEIEKTTIEHFIIAHKIERVKELLLYNELSLTEISCLMNYSSVAHLSSQFKKVTGYTPTYYKKLSNKERIPIEYL